MRGEWVFKFLIGIVGVLLLAATASAQARLLADQPLRAGMEAIRASIIDHHTLITHRRLPVARARSFAISIGQSVAAIRAETAVPPDARAALDPLLMTIVTSAEVIGAGGDSIRQMDALFVMTKAMETYGRTFDHPDWKPVQER